jgi:hypothetical protein
MGLIELPLLAGFVIGIILIVRGWRGTPEFSEPHCRKCDYDVRALDWTADTRICPECGSDLTQPKAVRFGHYRRRPKLIWTGVGLCLLPLVLVGLVVLRNVMGWRWEKPESNAAIIANLSTSADTPWDWRKLEDRYQTGDLSDAEVVAAIDHLIAFLEKKPQQGPLHWADGFLKLAMGGGLVDDPQLVRLCKAFYGHNPEIRMRTRIGEKRNLDIEIRSRNSWDLPGVQHVLALRSLTVDGQPVTPTSPYDQALGMNAFTGGRHRSFDPVIEEGLSPGTHELTFTYDWGLLVENAPLNPKFNTRPGQKEHWPKPIITWETNDRREVVVVPESEPVVQLVTDARRDPSAGISIERIQVFPYGDKLRLETKYKCDSTDIPLCMKMAMRVGDKDYDLGHFGREGNWGTSSTQRDIDALPADLTRVTVILTPDAQLAEQNLIANEIWGHPIVINNVPLERFDVSEEKPSSP